MHHYVNAITDTKGNALVGYFVRCVDASTGSPATLYADTALTPIASVSGVANAAQVNTDGNASFYIAAGTYHLDIYATDSTTFVRRIASLPMLDEIGNVRPFVTPQSYGAKADGVTDDSAAFVAAIAALKAMALNTGGSGYYKGSPALFIPAGHYYLGTTALDINHTLIVQGEGSGQSGPSAGGCTRLRWAAGANGIRIQFPQTSGNTTVDGTTHDGAGGVTLADMCLEGGFTTTEGEFHGLVIRSAAKCESLYIKNWQGEGVKAWAGNVTGNGNVSGNVSTTMLSGVKVEGCRGGFDIRGSDSNVVTLINCEGYQNRQFGYLDDNGAGSNTNIGMHCASNGLVTGTWPQTQCSSGGNRYALKWGGDPTVAPSGTTADTANWLYIEAGAAIANLIPAWVSTPNTFRAGGDYLTLNSAGVQLISPYSEAGGFSQFNATTIVQNGTISAQYLRASHRMTPTSEGFRYLNNTGGAAEFIIQTGGTEAGFQGMDLTATVYGYVDFVKGAGNYYLAPSTAGHNFRVGTFGSYTTPVSIDSNGLGVQVGSLGYRAGVGGAVTQATSKSTGVTLNKVCGQITMNSASLAATTAVSFTLTNSTIAAQDTVQVCIGNGATAGAYAVDVDNVGPGSCRISIYNRTAGALAEAIVLNFTVLKGVVS